MMSLERGFKSNARDLKRLLDDFATYNYEQGVADEAHDNNY